MPVIQVVIATTGYTAEPFWVAQTAVFCCFRASSSIAPRVLRRSGASWVWRGLTAQGFLAVVKRLKNRRRQKPGKIRRLTMRMGASQPVHSKCGRGVAGLIGLIGCLNTSSRSSAIRRLQFGCRKPKLRARRKPLGNTCCMSSHKKVAPLTVRSAIFLVLLSRYRKLTCPLLQLGELLRVAASSNPSVGRTHNGGGNVGVFLKGRRRRCVPLTSNVI